MDTAGAATRTFSPSPRLLLLLLPLFSYIFCLTFCQALASQSRDSSSSAILSRFQQYLQINTAHPSPNYHEAADFILSQAKSLSLESQTLEFVKGKPILVLKWPGKNSGLPSILLNSHTDVVPAEHHKWSHPPFDARVHDGRIYARGSQDMKCVGLQYLEAIRNLKSSGFQPLRTVYLSFVPDEEIGGHDGAKKLADSDAFRDMNVGIVLDEGLPSPDDYYRLFYGERCPWWLVIKAAGAPGHGAKLYDNTAMENLVKSIESVRRFRASQFDLVKSGLKAEGEVISVNMVFLKAGTPSPTGFVMNLQPSEAEAGFDIRVPPIADPAALEKRIAEEWAPASRNMTFEVASQLLYMCLGEVSGLGCILPIKTLKSLHSSSEDIQVHFKFYPFIDQNEGWKRYVDMEAPGSERRFYFTLLFVSEIRPVIHRMILDRYFGQPGMQSWFKQKFSIHNKFGKPIITATDNSNPWWGLLEGAIGKANGKVGSPEIFPASTDARYFRELGFPAIGFSPMANTPILLHDHNEFLREDEYLRGINIYESIIKAYASYVEHTKGRASKEEL